MRDTESHDEGLDPATIAAAESEPPVEDDSSAADATEPVHAVGIGPGDPAYLTPRARRAIREAAVVVGFQTVVEFVADETSAELLPCHYEDEAETLDEFAQRVASGDRGTAVLMGDPNHSGYQFLGKVERVVGRVRVIPGLSSLQIAASRARTPMEETCFVTLHKSGPLDAAFDRLVGAVGDRHLLVLPRPYDWMPGDIAELLVAAGADERLEALVFEHLTHDSEQVTRSTLGELSASAGGDGPDATPYSDLSVLAIRAPVSPG
jgi:cobalt-precorrin-7 (C5)-methyltransferase